MAKKTKWSWKKIPDPVYEKEYGIASELGFEGTLMKLRKTEEFDNPIDPSHPDFGDMKTYTLSVNNGQSTLYLFGPLLRKGDRVDQNSLEVGDDMPVEEVIKVLNEIVDMKNKNEADWMGLEAWITVQ